MKLKSLYFILVSVLVIMFASCLRDSDTELSSNPYFLSLSFLANDSIPNLEKAVFTLEYDRYTEGDSIITNLDSLPFRTRIDSIWPVFYFRSSYSVRLLQEKEEKIDTVYLGGNSSSTKHDTINFTYPTKVYNISADGTNERIYPIKINVHQVEPELYVWKKLHDQIVANADVNQKAIFFNGKYMFFSSSETQNSLSVADGPNLSTGSYWQNKTLSFPAANTTSLKLRYMVENKEALYLTDNESRLYTSDDGESWTELAYDLNGSKIYNLLFSMTDSLWAITRSDADEYRIAYSTTGVEWTDWGMLPEKDSRKFPINDYSSLVFKSAIGNPKVIIVGGFSEAGQIIPANWIGQINSINKQFVLEPLRSSNLTTVQDAAIVQYDKKILLFGGQDRNGSIIPLMESKNEGLSWAIPDSTSNMLPKDFPVRAYQSVFVNEDDKRIYLIGGKDDTRIYSDIWTAKLNRLDWEN